MDAFLNVCSGPEQGRQFRLDPPRPAHIGRGTSCEILLTDPMSSRFHAVVFFEDDDWHLRDTSSRNGTLVNGQKTDHARLLHQSVITIGTTDLQLAAITEDDSDDGEINQTMVADPVALKERMRTREIDPIDKLSRTEYVLDLYQLSLNLMTHPSVDDTIEIVLELLKDRTKASGVCLFYESHEGRLMPQTSVPKTAFKAFQLSRRLVKRIVKKNESIWIHRDDDPSIRGEIKHSDADAWSDLICCPLSSGEKPIGVLQLYRKSSPFDEQHFDFAIAATRLLAVGLVQGQQRGSLVAERKHIAERNAEGDELIGNCDLMVKLKER